jgi:hypothetical protein
MPYDALLAVLRARGCLRSAELLGLLGVSRPTLMRAVRAAGALVVTGGKARRTAYAARRGLRGDMALLPIYRVGLDGSPREVGSVGPLHPQGYFVGFAEDFGWPLDDDMRDGWFDGLPYPLQDMRPQGFLGRQFARRHAALLRVSEDPTQWSDDDALHALCLLGLDTPGDLIVGEPACYLWLERLQRARSEGEPALPDGEVEAAYPRLADEAMALGVAGSSAGGEFPKFTVLRALGSPAVAQHVLVKFSGSDDSPGSRRWSDLLVCEHLAGAALRERLGVAAAHSRIHRLGGRTFLEVDRFDRHGALGRSGLVSWAAVNGALFGSAGRPWAEAAQRLVRRGWSGPEDAARIERLWHFGRLIGNTDMHDANLSFRPATLEGRPGLALAPAYDMLPMLYAPQRGVELAPRDYAPRLPLPAQQAAWQAAADAALAFWQTAAADARIGAAFRKLCAGNAGVLRQLLG